MIAPALPLFPLPRVQLFPHAIMPLHVFEPRYRQLLADALDGDRLFVLPCLDPQGATAQPVPTLLPVCGVARVLAHEGMPDGRSNILVQGAYRARIVEELPQEHLYRRARLEPLPDEHEDEAAAAARGLRLLAEQLALRLRHGGELLRQIISAHTAPGPLTDVLAAALLTDSEARQQLLETLDVRRRVDALSAHIGQALTHLSPARGPAN